MSYEEMLNLPIPDLNKMVKIMDDINEEKNKELKKSGLNPEDMKKQLENLVQH